MYMSDEQRRMGANLGATLREGVYFHALPRCSLLVYIQVHSVGRALHCVKIDPFAVVK